MRDSVNAYLMFMWNRWNPQICQAIFGERGDHIWNKWATLCENMGYACAPALFWSELDRYCQEDICNYITKIGYKG